MKTMVSSDRGYPDPENTQEELSPNDEIVIVTTDTDTDEEDHPHNDYQPLPTHDIPETSDDDGNSDSEGAVGVNNDESLPTIIPMEEILVKEVWRGPPPKAVNIEMDQNKVDEVKQAMKNFTLPPSSIPEWANNIPEEQWKQEIINKLQQNK